MAIDTRERRQSSGLIGLSFHFGVTPNASKDQEWRQEAGWGYPGILAGALVIAATIYASPGDHPTSTVLDASLTSTELAASLTSTELAQSETEGV